jgi:hypothetical protein
VTRGTEALVVVAVSRGPAVLDREDVIGYSRRGCVAQLAKWIASEDQGPKALVMLRGVEGRVIRLAAANRRPPFGAIVVGS